MQVEIIEEDNVNWTAKIKFTHNDVEHIETYNLIAVIPGTNLQLSKENRQFDQTMKSNVITKLTEQVQREIEAGIITNTLAQPMPEVDPTDGPQTLTQ